MNQQVIDEFRANGGRVGGMFEGVPLVLLTTTGARTGRLRTNPAVYARDGDRLVVFASNAGGPRHPGWYHNLLADPRLTVEIGTDDGRVERYAVTARPLHGPERDRHYAEQCARDPAFAAYQAGTTRIIPVVALHRPDLTDPERTKAIGEFLLRVHGELRQELATLLEEVDAHVAAPGSAGPGRAAPGRAAPVLGSRLATHCLSFCTALHGHHTNEDGAFTDFERRFPELAPAIAHLRREHTAVARTVTGIESLVRKLTAPAATGDVEKLRIELGSLAADLEAHFAYEEKRLLPALLGRAD
ncbi:cation-binding protein [Streptomyces spinoverrucosus]|uniref:Cation-binding protein n=1 Tax=Streptomyces spinoverrucosus TaxID=284043 RepID=A0A4Y3V9Z4_9ACTN|nr:nitroreductase/quinone reductase family protein [Streptomyces spinoverrucosus]GEC02918.1 cation-binding protein [Streptomyces spinoverrucosus]GHB39598.1 cation-binding protein [Streptomyces spinoverrucosus]